jgi:beta-lactamase class A
MYSYKTQRTISRRTALRAGATVASTFGAAAVGRSALAQDVIPVAGPSQDGLSQEIIESFSVLPGQKALRLWAPPDAGRPAWSAEHNPDDQLFIASAFKGFVLAECLRLEEESLDPRSSVPLSDQLAARLAQPLPLDDTVFSLGSPVFEPPQLIGTVSLRTALEAMITHSDNTATDIVLRYVGPERVQSFVEEIGLQQSPIPTSTRQFFAFVGGLPNWQTSTWDQFLGEAPSGDRHPILNDTITMASTANELVSFYSRALQGEFFTYPETLTEFRTMLAMGDMSMCFPLGVNGFGKGGSIDFSGSHVLTFAGGLYTADRWVYFALLTNWLDAEGGHSLEERGPTIEVVRSIFTVVRDRLGA